VCSEQRPRYFVSWFRFQQQDGYLLWINRVDSEGLWTDAEQRVPVFSSPQKVVERARQLNLQLESKAPLLLDFDSVANWLDNPRKMPPRDSLGAWSMFDDLSVSIGKVFLGNVKAPVRNRVFDLLYLTGGIWRSESTITGPRQERKVLHRILRQGFRLWNKHVYWAD
jgi:hypothetical protein